MNLGLGIGLSRSSSSVWTPAKLPNRVLDFDASAGSSFTDQSGAGNNGTPNTTTPSYTTSGISGLPSWAFNGSSDIIKFGGTAAAAIGSASSIYVVCQPNTNTARDVLNQPSSTFGANFQLYPDVDGANARVDNNGTMTVAGAALGSPCVLVVLQGGNFGAMTFRRNTTVASGSRATPPTPLATANIGATQIGASSFAEFFTGLVSRVVICSSQLDAATDLQMRTFLQATYSIACTP